MTDNPADVIRLSAPLRDRLGGVLPDLVEAALPSGYPRVFVYTTDSARMLPLPGESEVIRRTFLPTSVGAGASVNRTLAQVRAIGEGIERYCQCLYSPSQFVRASAQELGAEALDLDRVARCAEDEPGSFAGHFVRARKDLPIRWVKGVSLTEDAIRYVPAVMVYLDCPPESPAERFWVPISTGCACHVQLPDALVSGICEVIERDALMLTWLHQLPLPRLTLGPLRDQPDPFALLIAEMERTGIIHHFFDSTSDLGVPTVYTLRLCDETDLLSNLVAAATRLDPVQAVLRTVEEGCSSMLALDVRFAANGVPDRDGPLRSLEEHALVYGPRSTRSEFDFLLRTPAQRSVSAVPCLTTGSAAGDLERLIQIFRARQMEVVAVDLTTPDVREAGFWVVRVVIPELIPLSPLHSMRFLDTPRLYSAPESMGYGRRTRAHITAKPQPFA